MKRTMLNIISLIFIFHSFSCKNDSVSPIIDDTPGRRDYEWSVDTVKSIMLSLINIWGSSPGDVWVVGQNGDFEKRLMHYDGNCWSPRGWWAMGGDCIYGFGPKDIYIGGFGIWHFDGMEWKKKFEPRLDSLAGSGVMITDIRGNNPNDLWAVGFATNFKETSYGIIYHRDPNGWKEKMVLNRKNIDLYQIFPTGEGSKCLIYGLKRQNNSVDDSLTVFEYDGNRGLKEIASASFYSSFSKARIYKIEGKLLIVRGNTIYEYVKGEYKEFILSEALNNGSIMGGRNKNDMFIWQREGLAHYNGTDTQIIFKLKEDIFLVGQVAVFEKEIFFLGFDEKRNYYLVKGKLKEKV